MRVGSRRKSHSAAWIGAARQAAQRQRCVASARLARVPSGVPVRQWLTQLAKRNLTMCVSTWLWMAAFALGGTLAWAASTDPLAPVGGFNKPADAPVKPVSETIWGRKVTDDYRYME